MGQSPTTLQSAPNRREAVERFVTDLVEAIADIEGTPYLKVTITSGTGQHYHMVVEKQSKIPKRAA